MFAARCSLSVLTLAGVLMAAAPVFAADEPIATANRTAPPAATAPAAAAPGVAAQPVADPGVAAQIDDYLKTSPALLPTDRAGGVTNGDEPRKVHGEVAFAVGTGGYRSAYVRGDFPVGKSGTLSVAVSESRFKGRFDPVQRQRLGLGLNFTGAAPDGIEPWRRHACLDQQRRSMDPTPGFDISSSLACPGPYPVQAEGDAR